MRIGEIVAEAVRSARHVQILHALLMGLILTGLTASGVWAAAWVLDVREAETAAGRFVLEATAVSEAGIPAARCQATAHQPHVLAAGGTYLTERGSVTNPLTGQPVSLVAVTPGTMEVWQTDGVAGVLVGAELASVSPELGTTVRQVDIERHEITIAGAMNANVPVTALQSSLVVPVVMDEPVSVCWARYQPGERDAAYQALTTGLGMASVVIADYAAASSESVSSEVLWGRIATAQPGGLAGVAAVVLAGVMLLRRRRDVAVLRLAGIDRAEVTLLLVIEHLVPLPVITPLAASWGLAIAAVFEGGRLPWQAMEVAGVWLAQATVVYAVGAIVLSVIASAVNPLMALRE